MLTTVEGVFKDGKIELTATPQEVRDGTPVIVVFLNPPFVYLRARGIDEQQARELRARLAAFAEEWESPEMDVYDNYDSARAKLQTR